MSTVKSFEQLAQSAYAAATKRAVEVGIREKDESAPWAELSPDCQETWIAATKQLWAEFAAIH
jgi:hypothetical protein